MPTAERRRRPRHIVEALLAACEDFDRSRLG
jgi:hypothetical protein